MTEQEWLKATDPGQMLVFLQCAEKVSDRKLRLFAVACCRRIWHQITDARCRTAVQVAERFADGRANGDELQAAQVGAEQVPTQFTSRWGAAWGAACADALDAAHECLREAAGWGSTSKAEQAEEVPFLRDIFGNPFCPAPTPASSLLIPSVLTLAQRAYDERDLPSGHLDPARLALLADALEDAGCTDAPILAHLRLPGPHVRGCWALDLIAGRS